MDDFMGFGGLGEPGGGGGDFWQEPDFLLTDLVSFMANKMDAQLGITLMIKGAVITGSLVGEREYLNRVNTMFKNIARDSLGKPTKDDLDAIEEAFNFDTLTEDVYPDDEDLDDEDDPFDSMPIRHLHLKDPMIIYPGSTISFTESALPIMRIRLNTIDGWMLGRITIMSSDDLDDGGMPNGGRIH